MTRSLRFVLSSLLFPLCLLVAAPGRAAGGEGTATIRRANDTLHALLRQKVAPGSAEERRQAAAVTEKLRRFLDIDELGRRAMRDHWANLRPNEQAEFTKLLRELVEAQYVRALRAELDYDVSYLAERAQDGGLLVSTQVKVARKGRPQTIDVDYALRQDGETWRVYDIVTDGVGLVENYRAQFNKVMAKEGIEGLLARMRKKRAET